MKCDSGQVQAYLDDALASKDRAALEEHLRGCARCQEELERYRQQGTFVAQRLAALDPQGEQRPQAPQALVRFWAQVRPAERAAVRSPRAARWRWAAVGLAALVIVATLFSFAPIRQAAAEFLGVFRVRKFAVIPVDPERVEQLGSLEGMVAGLLNEPTILREPGEPQAVSDAAEASAAAGFQVRAPTALPEQAMRKFFELAAGPAMRIVVDRTQVELLLLAAGVESNLPDVEVITLTMDFATVVAQEYQIGKGSLFIVQTPSPEATMVPDLDLTKLGEAMLQFLGMSPEDAQRLAQQIDWTTTLVIPMPTNVGQFREVTVDGVSGVLVEEVGAGSGDRGNALLLWQRDGIVYGAAGYRIEAELLLQIADSLR